MKENIKKSAITLVLKPNACLSNYYHLTTPIGRANTMNGFDYL